MNTLIASLKSITLSLIFTLIASSAFSNSSSNSETLVSFQAQANTATVEVVWQFAEDIKGAVSVQRAGADMNFITVGEHQNNEANQFTDDQPQSGLSFYRLAVTYANGSITYHKTVAISR